VPLASLSGSLTTLVRDHGLYAVFGLMLIDAVFPAASELVMLYGGAIAAGAFGASVSLFGLQFSNGFASYLAISLAGTIGYLLGSVGGWAIGLYGGRPLLERRGRWFHLTPERLVRAERWFDRYENWAVFLGRVTPVVRSFVSIPAGVFRVRLGRYTVLTLLGSALWCFALAGIGWGLGTGYERFHHRFAYVEYAVVAAVLALATYVFIRWRRASSIERASRP
jgi:membrane protein DedA with SNARE-associated domain